MKADLLGYRLSQLLVAVHAIAEIEQVPRRQSYQDARVADGGA